ncbi:DUF6069 family protein [Streptomyces sp. NPDC006326]|uniref:DUF6069 family protein n=1 Tax=Streptomyces sp. NPDC006326 TaxID=3156752 RepID=UPI00339E33DF
MTTTPTHRATPSLRRHAYAAVGAVLLTALLWTAARGLGVELRVDPGNGLPIQVVSLPLVVGSTLVVCLLAAAVRRRLDRLTGQAPTVWTRLAVTVLLLSLAPMAYVQASGATKAALTLMHLAVAAVLIPLLRHEQWAMSDR